MAMAEKQKLRIYGTGGRLAEASESNDGGGKVGKARWQFGMPKHEGGTRYL